MLDEALVYWERYPRVAGHKTGRAWLQIQANLILASNTIDAYGRGLEEYLSFSLDRGVVIENVAKDHIAHYVHFLTKKPRPHGKNIYSEGTRVGLSNATIQLRVTVVRLYYDYLIEEGLRKHHPVGRGRYTPGRSVGGTGAKRFGPTLQDTPSYPD
jgi:integrase/recombinase XerD